MKNIRVSLQDGVAVSAILGVLYVMIAPVIAENSDADASRQKTEQVTCSSNMKKIELAIIMYTQDYDEHFPSGANWHASGAGWAQQIYPYVESESVFRCPSDANKNDVVSYGINSNIVRLTANPPAPPVGRGLAELDAPSTTVATFEITNNAEGQAVPYAFTGNQAGVMLDDHLTGNRYSPWAGCSPAGIGTGRDGDPSGLGSEGSSGAPLAYATGVMSGSDASSVAFKQQGARHMGGSNMGFADGHVKRMLPETISVGYSNDIPGNCGTRTRAANTGCKDIHMGGTFSIL